MDPEHDRMVSDHVLRMHQYRAPGEQDGEGTVRLDDIRFINILMKLEDHFIIQNATKENSSTIPLLKFLIICFCYGASILFRIFWK